MLVSKNVSETLLESNWKVLISGLLTILKSLFFPLIEILRTDLDSKIEPKMNLIENRN